MLFGMDSETSSDECLEALAEDERQVLALPKVGRPLRQLERDVAISCIVFLSERAQLEEQINEWQIWLFDLYCLRRFVEMSTIDAISVAMAIVSLTHALVGSPLRHTEVLRLCEMTSWAVGRVLANKGQIVQVPTIMRALSPEKVGQAEIDVSTALGFCLCVPYPSRWIDLFGARLLERACRGGLFDKDSRQRLLGMLEAARKWSRDIAFAHNLVDRMASRPTAVALLALALFKEQPGPRSSHEDWHAHHLVKMLEDAVQVPMADIQAACDALKDAVGDGFPLPSDEVGPLDDTFTGASSCQTACRTGCLESEKCEGYREQVMGAYRLLTDTVAGIIEFESTGCTSIDGMGLETSVDGSSADSSSPSKSKDQDLASYQAALVVLAEFDNDMLLHRQP